MQGTQTRSASAEARVCAQVCACLWVPAAPVLSTHNDAMCGLMRTLKQRPAGQGSDELLFDPLFLLNLTTALLLQPFDPHTSI